MSKADQIYYRSAWSRGSMVQIGDTVYPNIGMNALQRSPESFIEIGISAIDDSWQWPSRQKPDQCGTANFTSVCADGLMQNKVGIWNSNNFSAEINWTIHSLSGEGSPLNVSLGQNKFGSEDIGTKFVKDKALD